jgi:hypothetical protein
LPTQPIFNVVEQIARVIVYATAGNEAIEQVDELADQTFGFAHDLIRLRISMITPPINKLSTQIAAA